MTDETPTGPHGPTEPSEPAEASPPVEHTVPLESFETVGPPAAGGGGSRRRGVIVGVAALVAVLLGGGAFAAYSFLDGGGAQPEEVLPASTLAVLSVDLDPSASQKIAAIRSIRKFPALKKSLGLQADDDLRKFAFDKIVEGGHCGRIDFEHDVKPWLGKRAALAAVDLGEKDPSPVVALQISDKQKAQDGFQALVDCTKPQDFGFAVGDDYLVASDSAAHARAVLDQGQRKPLADDATYRKWTDAAGDAGVLSFYVGPGAARYGERLFDDLDSNLLGSGVGGFSFDESGGSSSGPGAGAKAALKDFGGLGGTVRFSGGGMELSIAGGGIKRFAGLSTVGPEIGDLPADTAIALGFGGGKDFAKQLLDQLGTLDDVASAEDQTGLDLPDDLQTLLGGAVTLSLGGDAPHSLGDLSGPEELPAGLVLHGDAEKIKAVITKVEDHLGLQLSDVPIAVQDSGDKVALSTGGYGDELLKKGDLGARAGFRDAVPQADKAVAILYVDFNSPWRDALARELSGEGDSSASEFDDNTAPLRSLGLSTWQDGDEFHGLLKITTD
jgi:hypothetical protein